MGTTAAASRLSLILGGGQSKCGRGGWGMGRMTHAQAAAVPQCHSFPSPPHAQQERGPCPPPPCTHERGARGHSSGGSLVRPEARGCPARKAEESGHPAAQALCTFSSSPSSPLGRQPHEPEAAATRQVPASPCCTAAGAALCPTHWPGASPEPYCCPTTPFLYHFHPQFPQPNPHPSGQAHVECWVPGAPAHTARWDPSCSMPSPALRS